MQLPNIDNLIIEETKITGYLLSEDNSGGKSGFFFAFGFALDAWEILRDALLQHALTHSVKQSFSTKHGVKYITEGEVQTPSGRTPLLKAIWIVDIGRTAPRLVTAYPLEGKSS